MLVRGLQPYVEKSMGVSLVPKNVEGGGGAVGLSQALFSSRRTATPSPCPATRSSGSSPRQRAVEVSGFDTIARIITEDYTITVRADSDWKTLDDFIRCNPDGKEKERRSDLC
jgi:tripartite-type tricarboxylate transporter receptor subunit TctC